MKNAKDKAIGMETGVPQSKERKMAVPMRNDMQAQNAYPNPKANALKVIKGNSIDRLLKSVPMTESQRVKIIDDKKKNLSKRALEQGL